MLTHNFSFRKSKVAIAALLTVACLFCLSACGDTEPEHTLTYVGGEKVTVADMDCVAVYTEYTNNSGKTAIPADNVDVQAFQNGTGLTIIVPTGDKTNGYIQCDTQVQDGTTAKVVWIFQLDDNSTVSVELSDGTTEEITLDE